jgi:hypothetical protein
VLRCPFCRGAIDGALNLSGRTEPRDWDPAVCPHCAQCVVFEHGAPGGLRAPNLLDWAAWGENPALIDAIALTMLAVQKETS